MIKLSMKAARINAGLSQSDVAKNLKVTHGTVSNWETGKSFPNALQINQICELYGLSYEAINFLPNNPLLADGKEK